LAIEILKTEPCPLFVWRDGGGLRGAPIAEKKAEERAGLPFEKKGVGGTRGSTPGGRTTRAGGKLGGERGKKKTLHAKNSVEKGGKRIRREGFWLSAKKEKESPKEGVWTRFHL